MGQRVGKCCHVWPRLSNQCAPHVAIVLRQFQDAIHKWHDLFGVAPVASILISRSTMGR